VIAASCRWLFIFSVAIQSAEYNDVVIVPGSDKVTAEMSYKTPVSVLVLIHTAELQVLLLERADKAGFWQSVTGSLEDGETFRDAAIREVREETGLDAEHLVEDWNMSNVYEIYPHWRYRYAPGVTHNTEHVFGMELPQPVPVTLSPREHLRHEWVDWRDAAGRVFSWTNVEALRRLGERHGLKL
jgi:dATP pyrophosphohydrolase